ISVVDDQILAPTWTKDLCDEIIKIINEKPDYGTYHLASSGEASWSDFTRKIFEIKKRNINNLIENTNFQSNTIYVVSEKKLGTILFW
ncbi:MAG: sugar nucleotide-binding protein, partial [Malacoplasma sp.]|nr:sugar nucleotide-binding protein [Malacoplasma sp.]